MAAPRAKLATLCVLLRVYRGRLRTAANEDVTVEQLNVATMDIKPCEGLLSLLEEHAWQVHYVGR